MNNNINESDIIDSILNGNKDDFEILIIKYQNLIFRFINKQIKNPNSSEDILQDSFVAAFKNLNKLKDKTKFLSWLYGITQNIIRNYFNKILKYESKISIDEYYYKLQSPSSSIQEIEQQLDNQEILNAINTLPLELRQVITLICLEEMSYNDTANLLNIPLGTVKSRLYAARKSLKLYLEKINIL